MVSLSYGQIYWDGSRRLLLITVYAISRPSPKEAVNAAWRPGGVSFTEPNTCFSVQTACHI